MKTLLIADDHDIVREGIKMIVKNIPDHIQILEAKSCENVMSLLRETPIQFAIFDMLLDDGNIFTYLPNIVSIYNHLDILVYSMSNDEIYAKRMFMLGVKGYVSKQDSMGNLEVAIKKLLNGDSYISEKLMRELFMKNSEKCEKSTINELSNRELEVVEYLVLGMDTRQIGEKMNLDKTTILTYRKRAFVKLGVLDSNELKRKYTLCFGRISLI
jgi:DNA-binding NarL/FixJ family response regulator